MRRILTPGWVAWHLFVVFAFAACTWAFLWQLDKAESAGGDWQNWLYAIQWPMFAVMGLTPLSYAIAGAIAESGLTILFTGAGIGMIVLAAVTAFSPAWRAAAPPKPASATSLRLPV